ncbi:MAG TPA: hypothetical protein VKF36_03505 [Syntrophorhabdales bacterium]|nr:hypothetical protein [Syntrophorhabdales bacterium]
MPFETFKKHATLQQSIYKESLDRQREANPDSPLKRPGPLAQAEPGKKRTGGEIIKKGLPPSRQTPSCPPDKVRFFDWLYLPIRQMAKDLNTDEDFLFALAAREGGWTDDSLDHNMPLNNPFGVNKINDKGQAAGNKKYSTLTEAIEDWKKTGQGTSFGERVRNAKTAQEFVDRLQGKNMKYRPYNTFDDKYAEHYMEVFVSVPKYKKLYETR